MRRTPVWFLATAIALASAILVPTTWAIPTAEGDVRIRTAKLSPAPIKAGSIVTASVRIVLGGVRVRPTRVTCAGTIGSDKVRGVPRATRGTASCIYRTPLTAKGKTLRGSVAFTARGDRYVRRFAARLR